MIKDIHTEKHVIHENNLRKNNIVKEFEKDLRT